MSRRMIGIVAILTSWSAGPARAQARAQAPAPPSGTVIVAGMDDDSVWFVDLPTGERRGAIATHIAPHEVVLSSDGTTGVVTNYGDQRGPGNLIQVIDVRTASVVRELVVDGYERLHGAAFLPGDSLLAVTSERTGEILVVGMRDGTIRRTLSTGGRTPHMIARAGPWLYTANIRDGTLARVDPTGAEATRTWPAGTRTEGVAASPDGREGWTGSMEGGEVVGIDGETGSVRVRVEDLQVPYRLAVTSDGATVVVSDPGAGTLVLIDRDSGRIRARVDVVAASREAGLGDEPSPQGFTLSPDGGWAFVSTKGIDRVAVVDLAAARVVRFLPAGAGPDGIAFTPVRVSAGS